MYLATVVIHWSLSYCTVGLLQAFDSLPHNSSHTKVILWKKEILKDWKMINKLFSCSHLILYSWSKLYSDCIWIVVLLNYSSYDILLRYYYILGKLLWDIIKWRCCIQIYGRMIIAPPLPQRANQHQSTLKCTSAEFNDEQSFLYVIFTIKAHALKTRTFTDTAEIPVNSLCWMMDFWLFLEKIEMQAHRRRDQPATAGCQGKLCIPQPDGERLLLLCWQSLWNWLKVVYRAAPKISLLISQPGYRYFTWKTLIFQQTLENYSSISGEAVKRKLFTSKLKGCCFCSVLVALVRHNIYSEHELSPFLVCIKLSQV